MFILKYINEEDDLSVKEFESSIKVKEYIDKHGLHKTWHQIEEVKKVIPNFKQD